MNVELWLVVYIVAVLALTVIVSVVAEWVSKDKDQ